MKKMLKDVSRRQFAVNLAKALVCGGLVHFSFSNLAAIMPSGTIPRIKDCPGGREAEDKCDIVSGGIGKVENDYCPGGGPSEDVCNIVESHSDYCPGEKAPEDECSSSGLRSQKHGKSSATHQDDYCNTGLPEDDICDSEVEKSDQCLGQGPQWDVCDTSKSDRFDVCYSGLDKDDACEPNGGRATDECPGGGIERDTCLSDKSGDECPFSKDGGLSDNCKPEVLLDADACGTGFQGEGDSCYLGTNDQNTHLGGGDLCQDNKVFGIFSRGNGGDTCLDGSAEQDNCGGAGEENTEVDVCIPDAKGEKDDLCRPLIINKKGGLAEDTEDICYAGLPSSDQCLPEPAAVRFGDQDECPQGKAPADECIQQALDPDECPGGIPIADECNTGLSEEDECPGGEEEVDVCLSAVEGSDECGKTDSDKDNCNDGVFGSDECSADDVPDRCTHAGADYVE